MNFNINILMTDIYNDIQSGSLVFANENQFQFELAWRIKNKYTQYDVLFESVYLYKVGNKNKKGYTDLVVIDNNLKEYICIELKYKTKKINSNDLLLTNQAAQGLSAYDYLKDLSRLENLQNSNVQLNYYSKYNNGKDYNFVKGYAIMLTNDKSYYYDDWTGNQHEKYSFNKSRTNLTGLLDWNRKIGKKNNFGSRNSAIILKNTYNCIWYPTIPQAMTRKYNKQQFYYMILEV